jgi:hypothetical protein
MLTTLLRQSIEIDKKRISTWTNAKSHMHASLIVELLLSTLIVGLWTFYSKINNDKKEKQIQKAHRAVRLSMTMNIICRKRTDSTIERTMFIQMNLSRRMQQIYWKKEQDKFMSNPSAFSQLETSSIRSCHMTLGQVRDMK